MVEVILKKGKEKAALQRHPWIFSGALDKVKGSPANGEVVRVLAADKEFLAYGYFNEKSRVAVRMLEWDEAKTIDRSWYQQKIRTAIASRAHVLRNGDTNTCRLVFSEADFLPGLIVDRYADFLSLQILSAGIESAKEDIISILREELQPTGIFDKSDATARGHEDLEVTNGLLWGKNPPEFLEVKENGIIYHINIAGGQKSGFYCDQRDNRQILAAYTAGKTVLDCFSYSGGFSLNSFKAGAAHVTSVDSSALALETLQQNIDLNGFDKAQSTVIQSDVNKSMKYFKEKESFDLDEFANEVIANEDGIESFKNFKKSYEEEFDTAIPDSFDINTAAVKKQARVFKSIIKLDRNFHIYIHGDKELIEKGFDEDKSMNYYKVYFKEEA
eukprot:TRINITY_DN3272_c0_g3_i2.p1 TRINITY_DN3272_c0_g3~~TRINITY_DN3272_c0_g3_i2.p1  ORF type:complete len:387 (+),score=78.00 TRINITY_DN3272_c0_g3_i2:721-1881(+)